MSLEQKALGGTPDAAPPGSPTLLPATEIMGKIRVTLGRPVVLGQGHRAELAVVTMLHA